MRSGPLVIPALLAGMLLLMEGQVCAQTTGSGVDGKAQTGVPQVAGFYRATLFEECVVAARRLLDPESPDRLKDQNEIDTATKYLGACLIRVGKRDEAVQVFEDWIYEGSKRNAIPSRPVVELYGPGSDDAYQQAYERAKRRREQERVIAASESDKEKELEKKKAQAAALREAELLDLASRESVVIRNRRWLATVPFGVGQFQNGKRGAGWVFLTTELAALGVTLGGIIAELHFYKYGPQQVGDKNEADDFRTVTEQARRARLTWVVGLYTFGALATTGVIEAHVNYVPEFKEERKRSIPKNLHKPRVGPRALGVPGGVGLGIGGSF